jgi:hypothetical protein
VHYTLFLAAVGSALAVDGQETRSQERSLCVSPAARGRLGLGD